MNKKSYAIGGIIFFIFIIWIGFYISNQRTEQENSISIEDRIAGKYCSNLRHETSDNWDKCYSDVLNNVTKRFEVLHSCNQQTLKSLTIWTQEDWAKCYKDTNEAFELINKM